VCEFLRHRGQILDNSVITYFGQDRFMEENVEALRVSATDGWDLFFSLQFLLFISAREEALCGNEKRMVKGLRNNESAEIGCLSLPCRRI